MWSLMTDVCREMGVRTDVPFRDLTDAGKGHRLSTAPPRKSTFSTTRKTPIRRASWTSPTINAVYTVENALAKVKDEKGMKRVEKFLKEDVCPDCGGTRLSGAARAPLLRGISLDDACTMPLTELTEWVRGVPESLPEEMRPMAQSICEAFTATARRLLDLGLGYLVARPLRRDALHRRAPADAAGPRRAQPHDRRAVRAGRAVHRPAPVQHRGAHAA